MKTETLNRKRSRNYPYVSLPDAVESVRQISKSMGFGPFTREDLASAMGYGGVNGASSRRIAALAMYGLTVGRSNEIHLSELAKQLLRPMPGEEGQCLREAFLTADLFREVVEAFDESGKLPDALPVVLERRFGIAITNGDAVAKILRESGEYAGVFGSDGCIAAIGVVNGTDALHDEESAPLHEPTIESPGFRQPRQAPEGVAHRLPRPAVTVSHPESLSRAELEKVRSWLTAVVLPALEFCVEEDDEPDVK